MPSDPSPDETDAGADSEDAATGSVSRRTILGGAGLVGAGLVGAATFLGNDGNGDTSDGASEATARETTPVEGDEARRLAERFAPTLYFGRREKWFPTDPRPYASDVDGETVVDGFDALDGYTAARNAADGIAPDPTVFYHVRAYTERLTVVQYWLYSAFDQFSVNFHWHDWELLQAFVDRESDEAVLYVASAHSRKVPNNEYIDPETTPAIISEVGSHSSALGMNQTRDTFQRLPVDGLAPDVTNGVLAVVQGEEGVPLAYGLPRDEGFRLPYVVPSLDGAPLPEHPDLPNVTVDDLVAGDLTVRSLADLTRPPGDIPTREAGPVFEPDHRDAPADETYALAPTADVEDISEFTGPQLSFEFLVPEFVEDAVASHITTTSPPWDQRRYRDPLDDVTDTAHREAIQERFGLAGDDRGATIVGRVREVQSADDVDVGVTLAAPTVESVVRLASDPVAVPTFGGVAAFVDVEPGDHTLTVNGPGYAPYAQRVTVGADASGTGTTAEATDATDTTTASDTTNTTIASNTTTAPNTTDTTETDATTTASQPPSSGESPTGLGPVRVGTGGEVGLVPRADAVKLQVDAADRGGARRVRVDDDAAGRVYDAPPVETDGRAGVYVHRAGGYVVEVTDERGRTSVERVNPGPNQNAAEVAKARTGVSGITRFLVSYLTETRERVRSLLRQPGGTTGGGGDTRTERGADDTSPTPEATTQDGSDTDDGETTETATPTPTPTSTSTPTPTPTPTPTSSADATETPADRLRRLLDAAVARAERAHEAALAEENAATADALRDLRAVFDDVAALAAESNAPQPASRIAQRRVETADERAARALAALE